MKRGEVSVKEARKADEFKHGASEILLIAKQTMNNKDKRRCPTL
jgi:hypothetical protein